MNLDRLVSAGQPPWLPVPAAHDLDVWDKYDFPNCGTFRLGSDLVMFTLITTAGIRSIWAYVPIPAGRQKAVTRARFGSEAEFDAFVKGCFAGREAVFAAAENFVITSKSGGIAIPQGENGLLAAGARWYAAVLATARGGLSVLLALADDARADPDELLRAAQGALARPPA